MVNEAEKQRQLKYQFHDIHLDDIPEMDLTWLKSRAVHKFVDGAETNVPKIIIDTFMGYLSSHGYRIVKQNKEDKND